MPIQTASQAISNESGGNSPFGFKNRIINGAMVIDQRQAGSNVAASSVSNNGYHTADRWAASTTQSSKFTLQQVTDAPAGFKNSIKLTSVSAYSPISSDYFGLMQQIEGYNVADLDYGLGTAKRTSLSFWVKSSLTGTFGGSIYNGTNNRSYIFSYTVSATNTWQYVTVENIIGDTTYGTNTTNGTGLYVYFSFGAGANYVSTYSRSWITATGLGVTGQTNHVATNGATLQITGVQFEKGTSATSFDYRSYPTELQMCQRYYQKSYDIGTVPATSTDVGITVGANASNPASSNQWPDPIRFIVPMRTGPSISTWDRVGNASKFSYYNAGWTDNNGTITMISAGQNGAIYTQGATSGYNTCIHFAANAEL